MEGFVIIEDVVIIDRVEPPQFCHIRSLNDHEDTVLGLRHASFFKKSAIVVRETAICIRESFAKAMNFTRQKPKYRLLREVSRVFCLM